MSEGDYVRTKHGIEKITDIKEWVNFQGYEKIITTDKNQYETLYEQSEIIKSSPNIIDLIEVGDYVNGKKVVDKQYHYTDKDNYDMGEWCIFYENVALGDYQYDIKSIVTKEQFSCMEYKIGE